MAADKPWDVRIFEQIESGVDTTLIAENLKLTPTERLERMRQVLLLIDEGRKSSWSPTSARSSKR
jgi:hypothetical protein